MAKKKRKATRTVKRKRAVRADAAPACQLQEIPQTLDFRGKTGAKVTLITKGLVGDVLISKGEYDGKSLVPAGQAVSKIEFQVKAKRKTLKLVVVFEASIAGRGELREDCGGGESHLIRELRGDEPLQLIRITGEGA
jgi:hypothetical protein